MASETDRSKIVDIIKGGATPGAFKPVSSNVFKPLPDTAFTGKVKHTTRTAPVIGGTPITRFAKPEKKSKGFGGAFGALIDVIDWPASIIRSTIKEVRDIGKPDQSFSLKDWWKQGGGGPFASDKMYMGQIMRETGSPLGPEGSGEELAKGLALDILLDPITWFTGVGGAVSRGLSLGGKIPEVVKALNKAAGLAKTTDKANELRKAADRVQKTNSVLSAGKALDHIGIKTGGTFIIPGTGRLGRHFIEKPLSIATGGAVGRMARNARAKNVPSFVLPDTAFDVQRYAPQIAQSMKTIKKGDDFAKQALTKQGIPDVLQDSILSAAKFGRTLPVTMPFTIPGTATAISKIAPLPGMAFRWGVGTKIGQTLDKALNYRAPIRALKMVDSDPDLNIAANYIQDANNYGSMAASNFRRELLGNPSKAPLGYRMALKGAPETQGTGVMGLMEKAKRFGISNEDMMRASDRPTFLRDGTLNPELPESFRRLGQQGADFHQELRQWWDDAARLTNEALGKTQLSGFANDLYAARYLNEAGQEILGGAGWRPPRTLGSDTPWNLRPTVTPAQYNKMVAQLGEQRAAETFKTTWLGRPISDELFDTGRSVRDQIDEITVDVLGKEEARQIFSNDFEEVAQRYIMDMERGVRIGVVLKTLEDAGIVIPTTASGRIRLDLTDRLNSLTANASKFQDKIDAARVADRRLLELDELAEFGYPGLGSGFRSGPMLQLERDTGILLKKMDDFVSGNADWIPKGLKATIRDLNSVKPLATTGWANALDDYAGIANALGYQVANLRRSVNGMKAALTKGGQAVPPDLNYVERSIASMESALAQMNGLMSTAALGDETIVAARQMLRTLETGQVPKNMQPAMKKWADQYSEWVKLDDTTGSTVFLHQADEDYLTAAIAQINKGSAAFYGPPPSFNQWLQMARQGKIRTGPNTADDWDEFNKLFPEATMQDTPFEIGHRAGFSESDIARHYLEVNIEGIDFSKMGGFRGDRGAFKAATPEDQAWGYKMFVRDRGAYYTKIAAEAELPDLTYLTKLVEQTAGQATEKAALYTELLEEVTSNMKRFEEITPSMMEGLEEARLLATKDVLTPDEFFNQQKYLQSAKEQIMEIETEMQAARRSADLGRRVSAVESQEEAIKMINTERGQRGLSTAYNEALSNQLTGKWLQGMTGVNVGEHAELFASAIYAAARMNDPKALNKFWRGYGHLLNYWKAQAVATPGFFMRNMVGAVWLNSQIAGVEMGQHSKSFSMRMRGQSAAYEALKDQKYLSHLNKVARMTGKPVETISLGGNDGALSGVRYLIWKLGQDKVGKTITLKGLPGGFRQVNSNYLKNYEAMLRSGIAEGGQAASEVVEKVSRRNHYSALKFWTPQWFPFKMIRKRNEDVEFMVRSALAMDVLEKGGDLATAQRMVNKLHFDYAELTPTEAKVKMVIPFWKWQKSILPVLLESVGKQPKAWSRMHQIKGEIEYMSDEEGIVPDYFLENLGVRLPWRMDGSQVYLLPDLPFKDLNRWLKEPSSPARIFTEAAFPLAKLPIELWAGKQFFADLPLKGRLQQVPPVYENIPGLMPLLGSLNKAQKNRQGQWKMTDSDLYILDQMMPYLGRFRKLFGNEKKYQNEARRMTTWISVLFGGGLRVNTPEEQRNQLLRMQREDSEYYRDMLDLETREV